MPGQCLLEMLLSFLRRAFQNCSIETLVSFTGLGSEPRPLVRKVLDAYPLREASTGLMGCGLGVLLNDAINQTKALAGELRRKYFHRLPTRPESSLGEMTRII